MLPIVTGADNPILRKVAEPIPQVTKAIKKLAKDMEKLMHSLKGIGIAGPQVGESKRIFLATLGLDNKDERLTVFINPEITAYSETTDIKEEGCLSLPKQFGNVERPTAITVTFTNLQGQEQTLNLEGMDARVVQHEYDHLNGVLFIDKLA